MTEKFFAISALYRYSRFDEWLGKREWSTEGYQSMRQEGEVSIKQKVLRDEQ